MLWVKKKRLLLLKRSRLVFENNQLVFYYFLGCDFTVLFYQYNLINAIG